MRKFIDPGSGYEEMMRRQRLAGWGENLNLLFYASMAILIIVVGYACLMGYTQSVFEELAATHASATYKTSQGHQVVLTKVEDREYFDQAEIQILKSEILESEIWVITLTTVKSLEGDKPQAMSYTVHLEKMGDYTFSPLEEDVRAAIYGKKFIWLTPEVSKLASGKGVSILIKNLNPIHNISIVEVKSGFKDAIWDLAGKPGMSQTDL